MVWPSASDSVPWGVACISVSTWVARCCLRPSCPAVVLGAAAIVECFANVVHPAVVVVAAVDAAAAAVAVAVAGPYFPLPRKSPVSILRPHGLRMVACPWKH